MNEFDFNIGARVHCQDGQCGKLAKVVVHPDTWQVTDLIVEEGFLLKRARVFPVSAVERTTTEDIYLTISSNELNNFREYREVEYEVPVPGSTTSFPDPYSATSLTQVPTVLEKTRQGISSDELIVVEKGTPVMNARGKVGHLDHLITNEESNEITHLVVRRGALFSERLLVPVFMVEHVSENGILIAPTNNELKELARYTPEEDVGDQSAGEEVVSHFESIRHDEPTLSVQVAAALSADPRTRGAVVEVSNDQGTIRLAGQVNSWRTRQAAVEVASKQPGVVSVVDRLEVTTERPLKF